MKILHVLCFAAALLLPLAFAPDAEACCRPCAGYCDTVPDSTYCCSGYPEPGNACGFMTCGEYEERYGGGSSTFLTGDLMTPATVTSCPDLPFLVEAAPIEPLEANAG